MFFGLFTTHNVITKSIQHSVSFPCNVWKCNSLFLIATKDDSSRTLFDNYTQTMKFQNIGYRSAGSANKILCCRYQDQLQILFLECNIQGEKSRKRRGHISSTDTSAVDG